MPEEPPPMMTASRRRIESASYAPFSIAEYWREVIRAGKEMKESRRDDERSMMDVNLKVGTTGEDCDGGVRIEGGCDRE